jgi:L-alanine-DL-glutamate epimerase-like enolase superfamily enzyme
MRLATRAETWPLAAAFTISRGSRTETAVLVVELDDGTVRGRGEAVPNARYGETIALVEAQIRAAAPAFERGCDRTALQALLPHGAARNALDCALWDLEAKRAGKPAWVLAGLPEPKKLITAYTLSLGTPEAMAAAASAHAHRPVLKLKLGGAGDIERVRAVRAAAPASQLIADANEAWTPDQCAPLMAGLAALGVALIEQPLPAGQDDVLATIARPVPICADESCHDRSGLAALRARYDYVNIKLDKTGGLTEALALAADAKALGFGLMVGCMVGTSLGMAPAHLIGQLCTFVDIDAPLLLAKDRADGLVYDGSTVAPPTPVLWG